MVASSHKLAAALADRLHDAAPEQFGVRAEGANVVVISPDRAEAASGACRIVEDNDGRSLGDKVSTAVWQVMSGTQDTIVRTLAAEWPTPATRGDLLSPGVDVASETVRWWFGDETDPVLRFAPISFAEFVEQGPAA